MIGVVEVEQNFFMQNSPIYLVILNKSYITITKIETKVLNNNYYYIRIYSCNNEEVVEFLMIKLAYEKH